jgi:MFS family permease
VTAALLALHARTFSSLRKHRNYRLFFAGQLVSVVGTWMQNIALAWFVIELTRSPVAVGVLAFCRFAPFTLFGLFAGVLADRFDNRRLVIVAQTSSMVVSIALAALAFTGRAELWQAYLLAFLGGAALVFDHPGRQSLTFQMVGRSELPNAVALNAALFNAARVVGPSVAGIVIATSSVGVCFALNAVSFLAVLTSLLLMRPSEFFPLERGEEPPTIVGGIREGLRYVAGSPRVRLVLVIGLVVSTVGFNFHVLVPVLASDTLHAGPEVFGVLSASFGVGALLGALLAAALARASWKVLLLGTVGFSSTLLALAPQRTVALCAVLLFVTGLCFSLWTANSQSLLQLTAPDELRGRVLSLWLFAFAGLTPVGGLVAGWLAEVGGTELAFSVSGGVCLAISLVALRAVARSRRAVPQREGELAVIGTGNEARMRP